MVTFKSGAKGLVIPVVLSCICLLHVVSTHDKLDTAAVRDSPGGRLAEELDEYFQTLVRRRRQLAPRRDLDKMGFTEIESQAMLALHNGYRSTVNPTAANMIEVRWNDEIQAFAQNWSANCQWRHRGNRNLGSWINMGENLFATSGGKFSEKQAFLNWWNEYRDYTFETKACESGKQCGHYITAAWAKTEFIGCGITRCDLLNGFGAPAYFIVCNYSGRFLSNTRPFEAGTSCSNCPSAYPRCRYNLCVTEEMMNGCEGYNGTTIYLSETRANSVSDSMNCPDFTVDPVITTAPESTTGQTLETMPPNQGGTSDTPTTSDSQDTDSTIQVTTDSSSSNNKNTTDAEDGSCHVTVSSILNLVICLSSCFLVLLML